MGEGLWARDGETRRKGRRGHLPNGVLKIDIVHGGCDAGAASMPLRWRQEKKACVSSLPVTQASDQTSDRLAKACLLARAPTLLYFPHRDYDTPTLSYISGFCLS